MELRETRGVAFARGMIAIRVRTVNDRQGGERMEGERMHDEIKALLEDKATRLEERVYWAACLGLIASVTGGLFTWHAQFAPLDNGLTFICVGADPKVIPACAVDSGPWPAHHWLLTSIGAAIVILVIGRVLLFIHRIKSLST